MSFDALGNPTGTTYPMGCVNANRPSINLFFTPSLIGATFDALGNPTGTSYPPMYQDGRPTVSVNDSNTIAVYGQGAQRHVTKTQSTSPSPTAGAIDALGNLQGTALPATDDNPRMPPWGGGPKF